jgi:acyl carrier protein
MSTDRKALTRTVLTLLCAVAPEVDPQALLPAQPLRQQVDLDSMDWLNFLISLHARFGVEIAETDYAQLVCLNDVLDYLQARLP